jgi:hypothetical protein
MSSILKAVELGLHGDKVANLDKEHLKTAERLGPESCCK